MQILKILSLVLLCSSFTALADDRFNSETDCIGEFRLREEQDPRCDERIRFVKISYLRRYAAIVNEYEMNEFDPEKARSSFENQNIHEVFYQPIYGISFDNLHDAGGFVSGPIYKSSMRFTKTYRNSGGHKVEEFKDSVCLDENLVFHYKKIVHPHWFLAEKDVTKYKCEYDRIPAQNLAESAPAPFCGRRIQTPEDDLADGLGLSEAKDLRRLSN